MGKPLVTARMEGQKEFGDRLGALKKKIRRKLVKKSVTAGTKVFVRAAKARAPRRTKLLWKSIGSRQQTYRDSGVVVGIVGPRTGFGREVEVKIKNAKGTRVVRRVKRYQDPVRYGPITETRSPWMLPAFVSSKDEAQTSAVEVLRAGIEAEA